MQLPYFKPIDCLPTVLLGYITGLKRKESRIGLISLSNHSNLYINEKPGNFAVTHLQKYSLFGFLIHWPFCFHFWFQFKKQEGDDVNGWKPGTEKVFYFRTPGYRMDVDYGMKWTYGYFPSGHWD